MREYSIHEVTKLTGLSRTTILYYESKGLISPYQEEKNGYRKYTINDVSQIMFYQSLKPLGISVEEYAGTANKSDNCPYPSTYDLILLKKSEYMKRLCFYVSMWEETLVYTHILRHQNIHYQIQESREAWAFPEPHQSSPDHQSILKNWDQYFFQRNLSYFFTQSQILNHDYCFTTGLSCYADCALSLTPKVRSQLTYIPSSTCLLLVMPIDLSKEDFTPIFNEVFLLVEMLHLEIIGNPWGNIGYRGEHNGISTDYFFLWVPIIECQEN